METKTILVDQVRMSIVVEFDMLTGEMTLGGCDKNPVVALGMLDYALARVRRALAVNDMVQDAKNAPRVALAGGMPR
ncbi:MAG TPA: hypothetical protein VE077_17740 [Candidatus Methylomirabilis sp.]|nr:hypothetical protein [Candidatus Methylomirabilis sp.]